ncbi:MAG: 1-(5-phosphoribosyl)-5-[(5-phosphoribosylamino)methylideneamino]imidazole-4-carboxamide isomerase [Capnocytophaga sp.]|nr:1-(5-phosphoribosyl)-5-[(5-phosphoribosylamino)methylideneamino]imidazole-4-carboxamide isomerase [Capnocytophaga sp.]
MRIIPAIDLIGGKCVRLTKGDYDTKKQYHSDPLEVAKNYEDCGIRYLHLVDLDGAKQGSPQNLNVLEKIASQTNLHVDFGGGLRNTGALQSAFDAGAKQITAGSIAVSEPETVTQWIEKYGSDAIILGADCKDGMIATHGWQETSSLSVFDFIENYHRKGIQYVICTDIAKDGMLQGASVELYKEILAKTPVHLVASGGVTTLADLDELSAIGCGSAIIGKAIYEGTIHLKELSSYIVKNNL